MNIETGDDAVTISGIKAMADDYIMYAVSRWRKFDLTTSISDLSESEKAAIEYDEIFMNDRVRYESWRVKFAHIYVDCTIQYLATAAEYFYDKLQQASDMDSQDALKVRCSKLYRENPVEMFSSRQPSIPALTWIWTIRALEEVCYELYEWF